MIEAVRAHFQPYMDAAQTGAKNASKVASYVKGNFFHFCKTASLSEIGWAATKGAVQGAVAGLSLCGSYAPSFLLRIGLGATQWVVGFVIEKNLPKEVAQSEVAQAAVAGLGSGVVGTVGTPGVATVMASFCTVAVALKKEDPQKKAASSAPIDDELGVCAKMVLSNASFYMLGPVGPLVAHVAHETLLAVAKEAIAFHAQSKKQD